MLNNKLVLISVAGSRTATHWPRTRMLWSDFVEKVKIPQKGTESYEQYKQLKKALQDEKKDVGGFVGGTFKGDRRKKANVEGRDLITLDLDNLPPGSTNNILKRISSLCCAALVYSTRKHSPQSPRLRVVIPTNRTVTADEYEPIARKLAQIIGIDLCDPTTFDNSRLMYWPSICSDGEYIYQVYDNGFLDADAILSKYKNWRNQSEWPIVSGTEETVKQRADKQADPTTKDNIIGRFCRVYDIEAAMDKFLPGVYEACTGFSNRYTYKAGSTAGGAVIYNDGKFLYSNHATDPCSGMLVNSFDLVRLHKFSELDESAKDGTPISKLPSFLAMEELAKNDNGVKALTVEEQKEKIVESFAEVGAEVNSDDFAWLELLERTKETNIIKNKLNNFILILENDINLKGRIALDEFNKDVVACGNLPWKKRGRMWNKEDDAYITAYIEKHYDIVNASFLEKAVTITADKNVVNSVWDYLRELKWDGVKRIDTLLHDYLGAEQSIYTAEVMKSFLTAAVARAKDGGIKYDYMPIFVGAQGIGKSTFLSNLGKNWFSDSLSSFEGKEGAEQLKDSWILEVGELAAMSKFETSAIKQFLSKKEDIYRPAYGRRVEVFPRRCVFAGTSNESEFLRDTTGNRRFLAVDVGVVKATKSVWDDMPGEVDQIWAEAVECYKFGASLRLSKEADNAAREQQESHMETSPYEGAVQVYLDKPIPDNWYDLSLAEKRQYLNGNLKAEHASPRTKVCINEIWEVVFDGNLKFLKKQDRNQIAAAILKVSGWSRGPLGRFGNYGRQKSYVKVSTIYP